MPRDDLKVQQDTRWDLLGSSAMRIDDLNGMPQKGNEVSRTYFKQQPQRTAYSKCNLSPSVMCNLKHTHTYIYILVYYIYTHYILYMYI